MSDIELKYHDFLEDLGYIAGIFDGEGSVAFMGGIDDKVSYGPRVTVTSTCRDLVDFMAHKFGGGVYTDYRSIKNPKHQDCHRWELRGYKPVYDFLQIIKNRLIIKKDIVEMMLDYISLRLKTKTTAQHNPLTDDQLLLRCMIFEKNRRSAPKARVIMDVLLNRIAQKV